MDFAPYQDTSPETHRALSPPPASGRRSTSFTPPTRSPAPQSPNYLPHPSSNPWQPIQNVIATGFGSDIADAEAGRGRLDEFATSLPMRLDYEACLAYLLLPPAGGVFLLVVERKSDYVRFHAWQSSLLFSAMFILHLLFMRWTFFSWIIFLADIGLMGYLTYRAYIDADTLDRFEVPFFGPLASRFLDDE